jgi:hypothetical protein
MVSPLCSHHKILYAIDRVFALSDKHLECRKIYYQDIDPKGFLDGTIQGNYAAHDYHRVYYGEILAAFGEA